MMDSDSLDRHRILVQTQQKIVVSTDDDIHSYSSRQPCPVTTTDYYVLDVLSGAVSTLPCTVQNSSGISSMVALSSRIYIFGSPINNSNAKNPSSAYFLDFTKSSNDSDFKVLDPTKPKTNWRCVKSAPPGAQSIISPVLVDHENDRIIAFFEDTSSLYAYYPSREQWECVVDNFGSWFQHATKQKLNVQVSPDAANHESYLHLPRYNSLVYLVNGILCLLASRYKYRQTDPQTQTTLVHVVQIKVQHINNHDAKEVLVIPLSDKYYDLDSPCTLFTCLAF
ncbi:hypothetical protein POM88_014796 [Heracleum sosnowskyi]|uniref:Uncharacterized protein n=1 Tax=Heracleum sosnowskyi TaxID=360622 RepID=A0AAD8IK31_9APIA|nr:hypothetical protein POM88_014796 [Heracleum sosnowskyi]